MRFWNDMAEKLTIDDNDVLMIGDIANPNVPKYAKALNFKGYTIKFTETIPGISPNFDYYTNIGDTVVLAQEANNLQKSDILIGRNGRVFAFLTTATTNPLRYVFACISSNFKTYIFSSFDSVVDRWQLVGTFQSGMLSINYGAGTAGPGTVRQKNCILQVKRTSPSTFEVEQSNEIEDIKFRMVTTNGNLYVNKPIYDSLSSSFSLTELSSGTSFAPQPYNSIDISQLESISTPAIILNKQQAIDTVVTPNSQNLITSGAVNSAIVAAREEGVVFRGIIADQTALPTTGTNGDLYWISEFVEPVPQGAVVGASGAAIWHSSEFGGSDNFEFTVDTMQQPDNQTIGLNGAGMLEVKNDGITNEKFAQSPAYTLKGNDTGSAGGVTDIVPESLAGILTSTLIQNPLQRQRDDNLQTIDKTIIGAINEVFNRESGEATKNIFWSNSAFETTGGNIGDAGSINVFDLQGLGNMRVSDIKPGDIVIVSNAIVQITAPFSMGYFQCVILHKKIVKNEKINSFPMQLIDGAQTIPVGAYGFYGVWNNDAQPTFARIFIQTQHTSGSFGFGIYDAETGLLAASTHFNGFGDFTRFSETLIVSTHNGGLVKGKAYYFMLHIDYTTGRYLGCRTFQSNLSGSGTLPSTGVAQTLIYSNYYTGYPNSWGTPSSTIDPLTPIDWSRFTQTFPNQTNMVFPFIEFE